MARKVRVQYPGAIYHVMNRGDHREDIFRGDTDRWIAQRLHMGTRGHLMALALQAQQAVRASGPPTNARNMTESLTDTFPFLNGQLDGRVTVEFRADYSGPKTGFTIDATVNLNGSPNLQP